MSDIRSLKAEIAALDKAAEAAFRAYDYKHYNELLARISLLARQLREREAGVPNERWHRRRWAKR